MTEHRYTVDEIDRMRAALFRKLTPPLRVYHNQEDRSYFPEKPSYEERQGLIARHVEDQLRTCLIAGIRPEEMESPA